MAWFLLFVAGLFEIGWAVGLKFTDGFSRPLPTALTVVSMVISIALLGLTVRTLPIGTAYAVWTGIGTVGTCSSLYGSWGIRQRRFGLSASALSSLELPG